MLKQPSSWVGGSHTSKAARNKVGIVFKTLTAQSKKSHHKHSICWWYGVWVQASFRNPGDHIGQTRSITFMHETNLQGTVFGAWWKREVFGDEDNTWKMDCCCECLSPALRWKSCQGRCTLVKPELGLCFVFVLLLTFSFQYCTYKSDLKA